MRRARLGRRTSRRRLLRLPFLVRFGGKSTRSCPNASPNGRPSAASHVSSDCGPGLPETWLARLIRSISAPRRDRAPNMVVM
jgi:hypothetical protein